MLDFFKSWFPQPDHSIAVSLDIYKTPLINKQPALEKLLPSVKIEKIKSPSNPIELLVALKLSFSSALEASKVLKETPDMDVHILRLMVAIIHLPLEQDFYNYLNELH